MAQAVAMAAAAACVGAAAVPVGAVCWLLARRWREPVVPRYRKTFARWDGFEAALLSVLCVLMLPALTAVLAAAGFYRPLFGETTSPSSAALALTGGSLAPSLDAIRFDHQNRRTVVAGLLLMPVVTAGFVLAKRYGDKERGRASGRRFVADVAAGVGGWLVLMPLTLAAHGAVNVVCVLIDFVPDEHPLKFVSVRSPGDVFLLLAGACVVAPFFEEMGFRRVLVPWAARRSYRPWILLGLAALMAYTRAGSRSPAGPLAFVGLAAGALFAVERWVPAPRPAMAVLATATLFAALHTGVWPTPVPLLVLAVGLGWLVLRTKTVTAAVVAHGLFNAVSAVFLLRGPV